jgi:hypothetical protein
MRSAEDAGAAKLMVRPDPPTSAEEPESEMAVPAVADVVATFWSAPEPTPYRRLPEVKDTCPVPPEVTARVPEMLERVVVAVHVGMPFTRARTVPLVVDAIRARDVGVFAKRMSPDVYVVCPVPPKVAPIAVPFQVPVVTVPKKELPETESAVVEAYGNCEAATVEDEKKTPWDQMLVVVAAVDVLQVLAKSKDLRPVR